MSDFNASRSMRKNLPIYCLGCYRLKPSASEHCPEKFYRAHFFDHEAYGQGDGLYKRPSDGFTKLKDG